MKELTKQHIKSLISAFASLPIAIIVFYTVFLFCGLDVKIFETFYEDIISSLTLSSLLTQRTFKEAEKKIEHCCYQLKYLIVSIVVVLCGVTLFALESFFVLRYYPGQEDIIVLHRYWFTIVVMTSLFFFDHQIIHHPYPYKVIFWYLISWVLYYVVNDSIPLPLARTMIYIGFYRHHILRFMPNEFFTTPNRLVVFSILFTIHTIVFQELAMLSEENIELAETRAIYYQSFLNFGFTITNHRLMHGFQKKVLEKKSLLTLYLIVCYAYAIIIGAIVMLIYHMIFFPYFFSKVISSELPRSDSLYVSSCLSWIDRVSFIQSLVYTKRQKQIIDLEETANDFMISQPDIHHEEV